MEKLLIILTFVFRVYIENKSRKICHYSRGLGGGLFKSIFSGWHSDLAKVTGNSCFVFRNFSPSHALISLKFSGFATDN